jgi:magnesium transporter
MRKLSSGCISDWIAHGIIDSIVDSYFPFLEEIEREILSIENLIFSDLDVRLEESMSNETPLEPQVSNPSTLVSKDSFTFREKNLMSPTLSEKLEQRSVHRMQFAVPKQQLLSLRRIKQFNRKLLRLLSKSHWRVHSPHSDSTPTTVQRVAHIRRLVTSLSRFLATKSEVVAQIKKRMLMTGEHGLGNGTGDDRDVFIYMGDVQGTS